MQTTTPPSPGLAQAKALIRGSGLTRSFGGVVAVHPFDFEVRPDSTERGAVVGLLGPNGSGKSTFLRMLTGLVRPDAGSAQVCGVELVGDGTRIRQRVTYSPGELHMYGEMKAAEHITWLLRGRPRASRARALEIARELELPLKGRVRTFSHGMKRQLIFAAALAPKVPLRILDEPTEGLDPSKRRQVLDLLAADARDGTTTLLSSHHLGEVDRVCERLVFFNAGRLIADETPASIQRRAGRTLRVTWPAGTDLQDLAVRIADLGAESVHASGNTLAILLKEADPRSFLARFAAQAEWPQPVAMEHGRLSLQDLYRELYGVEGC